LKKKKKKIYFQKAGVARKSFNPSTLATKHTIKQKYTKYTQTLRAKTTMHISGLSCKQSKILLRRQFTLSSQVSPSM